MKQELSVKGFLPLKTKRHTFSSETNFGNWKSPLKIMKNAPYFTLKALLVLKIIKCLSWLFGHAKNRLDQKDKVNFKIYEDANWIVDNYNTHIVQYLKK